MKKIEKFFMKIKIHSPPHMVQLDCDHLLMPMLAACGMLAVALRKSREAAWTCDPDVCEHGMELPALLQGCVRIGT